MPQCRSGILPARLRARIPARGANNRNARKKMAVVANMQVSLQIIVEDDCNVRAVIRIKDKGGNDSHNVHLEAEVARRILDVATEAGVEFYVR
jgi:hypothetical protein